MVRFEEGCSSVYGQGRFLRIAVDDLAE